ncbi:MAG: AMP-binding protein [Anaerolineales bacterium]|nr:AMP-binding protein [Anaerolineales bacterium]
MTEQFTFGGEIVWRPSPQQIEHANLTKFMHLHNIKDFDELMQKSTSDVAWFTDSVLKFLDIQFYEPYSRVVDLSEGIQFPKWCIDAKMNIVHNCVDKYAVGARHASPAIAFEGEEGITRTLTYEQLYKEVNKTANGLRSLGLGKGDAIGIFMPMTPEIVIALLAIAKIGGIILPLFSGYGAGAIVSRMNDAEAKALFACDGSFRRDKAVEMKSIADEATEQIPTLKHMIVLKRTNQEIKMKAERDIWWDELINKQSDESETEKTNAEDPLMIIYTSGTTGKPKGALHTHCGFPIKAAQDMSFGTDVHQDDVIYWMTDMGWMMGPWLVFGSLILGATMFLYDGAPDFPAPNRLWELAEKHKINQMGVSPTLIRSLIPHGEEHFKKHNLSSLKCFASTGEPWNPDPWMWLFEKVGNKKIPIINYSGGTEISGGIVMGNPLLPLKPCAFSAPCPGMNADVVNEDGKPLRDSVGELVIKSPWIGMTRGFWKDKQRYLDTYWSRWDNVWVHGDFAAIDKDGLWYILGRSDDTIKIAGKRLGPAEVESILVKHKDIVEAAAIGVPHEVKGSELILFAVTKPNIERGDALRQALNKMVIDEMGKPLAPKAIIFVSDLPKTRNAKVMRRMIRAAYLGLELGDISSLVNPQAVDEIKKIKE